PLHSKVRSGMELGEITQARRSSVTPRATACSASRCRHRAAALLCLLAMGCARERVFYCESTDQCALEDVAGFCQPSHFCRFPDADCPSGQRYGDYAPEPWGGVCVAGDLVSDLAARWGFDEGSGTTVA